MKQTNIEDKIRTAVMHSVPDVLDSILSDCEEQKGNVIKMNTRDKVKYSWLKSIGAVVVAFAVIAAGITGYGMLGANSVDSVISFDVNPSLEIKVNKNEKVLEVNPLNEDARTIVGNMDFKDTDLEITVNALIGSMLNNGYIDEVANSILISVESRNETKGATLQAKLAEEIEKLLQASSIDGAIVSQTLLDDDDLKALADENHITRGKAQLIRQLVKTNENYKFEDLAKLSINELSLLIGSGNIEFVNASLAGKASDKAYIGMETAVKKVTEHAGVNAMSIKGLEIELEYDDGKMVYEVEFYANGREYDYEIDAKSGAVIDFDVEEDDNFEDNYANNSNHSGNKGSRPTEATPTVENPSKTDQVMTSRMSAAQARHAVINKFGGIIQKIEYNYDKSNPLYKGEALKEGQKVVFELNARTQSFKKWDTSNDNSWDSFSHAIPNMITMDQATNMVINKSGKSNTFVQKNDFLWDDSEPLYQGEAFNRGYKYSFEIYANSGKFQKWDSDSGDDTWAEKYYNVK